MKTTHGFTSSGHSKPNPRLVKDGLLALGARSIDDVSVLSNGHQLLQSVVSRDMMAESFHACFQEWEDTMGPGHRPHWLRIGHDSIVSKSGATVVGVHSLDTENSHPQAYSVSEKWRKWQLDAAGYGRRNPEEENRDKTSLKLLPYVRSGVLFRTNLGYVGLEPLETMVGDSIVTLAGGRTPLVLCRDNSEIVSQTVIYPLHSLIGYAM